MSIVIEKGVPVPKKTKGKKSAYKYRLDLMEVGDSFVCARSSLGYVWEVAKRFQVRLMSRKVDDKHVRVWRMK